MRLASSTYVPALAVLLVSGTVAAPVHATPGECKRAIIAEYRSYSRISTSALQQCEDKIVRGKLPTGTDCQTEPIAAAKLAYTEGIFRHHVNSACGGNNHTCNPGDTGNAADETLASIGWDIGTCPNFESSGCNNAIADCNDIIDCIFCLTRTAQLQADALSYDALNIPAGDRALQNCQREIGKRAIEFLSKKVRLLARCERKVLSGDLPGPCPDPGTQQTITLRDQKARAKICGKCGGADKVCGGAADRTPAEIGFVSSCPGVTVPGGAACGGAIATTADIATCVDCVSEFKADCLDAGLVPALKSYPAECNTVP